MRVLIADKFQESGLDALRRLGCKVELRPDAAADDLPGLLRETDPDVLVVRSTRVSGDAVAASGRLGLVLRAGAGYDTIDVDAASARGVSVANCPGKNSIAVAELAWGLLLACDRRIPEQAQLLRENKWAKKEYSKARGLYGRTLGVVGLGRIGLEVARRGKAFGMEIIAWSRSLTVERAALLDVTMAADPLEIAKHADVVSVHVAANPSTEHLIGEDFCAALRPGAIFVNTTRGSVVDERALARAIEEKGVRAGLDVYASEPGASDRASDIPLAKLPGVVGTHHIGASTDQAQDAIASEAVRVIAEYKRTGSAPNVVNRETTTRATRVLSVRHLNKPGVLAHIVGEIGRAGVNIEQMENVIYAGAAAACARIELDEHLADEVLAAINDSSRHILSVDLTVIE